MKLPQTKWLGGMIAVTGLLLAFLLGLSLRPDSASPGAAEPDHAATAAEEATTWTCSMHPQIQMPEPGACPLCGMDLIPLASGGEDDAGPATLTLSESARTLAEVRTSPAARRDVPVEIRMVGKLEADETRVRRIAAWVPGRIDRLHVDFTGAPIGAGERLFDLYSPELYSAQEELLQALAGAESVRKSGLESTRLSSDRTVEAARERLRLWGLTNDQITRIETRGSASEHVTIFAPMSGIVLSKDAVEGMYVRTGTPVYTLADLSTLWLELDAYESDLAWIGKGQPVDFLTDAFPGETYSGTVTFVDPVLDERSRTVKVRVDVANPDGRLLPGMFARARLHANVPGDDDGPPLVIPATAPLVTGTRAVVYVADPDDPGRFEGREIVLGPKAGDSYVVREGLEEGELVVVHGAFKIDSALQIRAKRSMMNPTGGESGDPAEPDVTPFADVPPQFRARLDPVLADYYEIGRALSRDDHRRAREIASGVAAKLDGVKAEALSGEARTEWHRAHGLLGRSAGALASSASIDEARLAFHELSRGLIRTLRRFGASGNLPALVFHCPMAMDSKGADWLQGAPGTENPYYGSQMFKCGSQTEVLVAGDPVPSGSDVPRGDR